MAVVTLPPPLGGRLILDTGGLLAWAYGNTLARAVIRSADRQIVFVIVPVVIVAQAIRGGAADAPVNIVLKRVGEFAPITLDLARQAGALLAATKTTDVVDALVAAEALRLLPSTILTSDPGDLRRLIQSHPDHARVRVIPV